MVRLPPLSALELAPGPRPSTPPPAAVLELDEDLNADPAIILEP